MDRALPLQRLEHRSRLHLVVVAADQRGPAAQVRLRHHREQAGSAVGQIRLGDQSSDGLRRGRDRQAQARRLVQERHLEVHRRTTFVGGDQRTGVGKAADFRGFDPAVGKVSDDGGNVLRRDGKAHPLLRFRDPDFPRAETRIFERHALEPDFGAAGFFGHLTDRRGQPACAVVGQRADQALIPQLVDQRV